MFYAQVMRKTYETYNWGPLFPHNSSAGVQWLETQLNDTLWMDMDTYNFVRLRYPILLCLGYLLSVFLTQPSSTPSSSSSSNVSNNKTSSKKNNNNNNVTEASPLPADHWTNTSAFKFFVFVHNMILCIFSAICFYHTCGAVNQFLFRTSLSVTFCQGWAESYDGTFGYWSWLFYLSKYYEFVDTWLLIAKGRRPIFLQTFHHVGAVFACWFGVATRSNAYYLFLLYNSFIHTFMYCYYAFSVIGIRFKYKMIITAMQITQLVVGWASLFFQCIFFSTCLRKEDVVSSLYVLWYLACLFILFRRFYSQTYTSSPKIKKKEE